MDQPFKAFAEPSCFTSTFDCEFDNTAADPFEETEAQRMYRRKLSFRDTFDFENESTDASEDFLSDLIFTAKRKLTGDIHISNLSPKKLCHAFETEKAQQQPEITPQTQSNQQHAQILFGTPSYNVDAYPHMNEYAALNQANQKMEMEMEEEIPEIPIMEHYQRETSLVDQLNNRSNMVISSPSMKENMRPINRNLELKTNFGFSRQQDSPTSCLIKSHSLEPNYVFESPGKRYNNSSLNTCKNLRDPDLRTITPETLVELMHNTEGKRFLIIDCRFEYEYLGGHIRDAINIIRPDDLDEVLIKNRHLLFKEESLNCVKADWRQAIHQSRQRPGWMLEDQSKFEPPILVFHCEFSQKRGPRALRALRNLDRTLNSANWPTLSYPEVYILENGYKNFHSKFPELCDPINQYIRMVDKSYKSIYSEAKMNDRKFWKAKDSVQTSPKPVMLQRFKTMHCI